MDPIVILIAVLGFVAFAGLGLVFAGGGSGGGRSVKRAQTIVKAERSSRAKAAINEPAQRRKAILKSLKDQERSQRKAAVTIEARLQQAGLKVTVQQFWIVSGVFALLTAVVLLVMRQALWTAASVGFVAGLGLPRWVVGFMAKQRTKKFTAAFSDAIDVIVRGIKSGLPVNDCLRIIARESPAPLGPEFQGLVENVGMGMTMEQGLEKMYMRMPTSELRFFTIVLAIQQKTGGNLAEALGNLSAVLRARKLMREKVKALSSEATASAMIIGSLPPGVVALIQVTSPAYMSLMYTDPRGHLLLLGGVLWMSTGIFVMHRMINFKF
ncbi:MAG TPA: type II secretion system F family protein [Caulobacteraceae bacterium]|jgi:tight adherence protein B|nr:type II secretion system F family protein [Caulobacteraceae bacterium]